MNLNNIEHINQFRRLRLPANKCLIVGSGTLALFGLKKNNDIDVWVTDDLYNKLHKHKDLKPVNRNDREGRIFYETHDGNIEITKNLPCTNGNFKEYFNRSITVYGIHFKSLNDVLTWKKCMGRPKDLKDIRIIKEYLKRL